MNHHCPSRLSFQCRLGVCNGAVLLVLALASTLGAQTPKEHADWPQVPAGKKPTYMADTTRVTMWGVPEKGRFLRRVYLVIFKYPAPGGSVRAALRGMRADIEEASVSIGTYFVTVPDPGPAPADIDRVVAGFRRFSAVKYVTPWPADPLISDLGWRNKPPPV